MNKFSYFFCFFVVGPGYELPERPGQTLSATNCSADFFSVDFFLQRKFLGGRRSEGGPMAVGRPSDGRPDGRPTAVFG